MKTQNLFGWSSNDDQLANVTLEVNEHLIHQFFPWALVTL